MIANPYLSVILPCRNQADHIAEVLERYFAPLERTGRDFELVVVPNACTDRTEQQQVGDDNGAEAGGDDGDDVPVAVARDVEAREQEHPSERQRDEDLPTEVHQLVVAEPRERGAEPHEHEQEDVGP